MNKKLAIKGHPTRGNEVIELLEMLDGHNGSNLLGNKSSYVYFITDSGEIGCRDTDHVLIDYFTLEEFLEKYPYKVGDKVLIKNCSYLQLIISMKWDDTMRYLVSDDGNIIWWYTAEELKDFNTIKEVESTGFMQMGKTIAVCFNKENYETEVELQLGDYEIEVRNGKTYAVLKKSKYPTNYQECCDVLGLPMQNELEYINKECNKDYYYNDLQSTLNTFVSLKICRDAYWKIAGEELGLNKSWKPDWNDHNQPKFGIHNVQNNIRPITLHVLKNLILVFPTEEIRDAFYENFKDLIEQCKELL